ncbi:hypothetical protein BKA80DRAFT_265078, partial [Phyllosticta citrichinensis]
MWRYAAQRRIPQTPTWLRPARTRRTVLTPQSSIRLRNDPPPLHVTSRSAKQRLRPPLCLFLPPYLQIWWIWKIKEQGYRNHNHILRPVRPVRPINCLNLRRAFVPSCHNVIRRIPCVPCLPCLLAGEMLRSVALRRESGRAVGRRPRSTATPSPTLPVRPFIAHPTLFESEKSLWTRWLRVRVHH